MGFRNRRARAVGMTWLAILVSGLVGMGCHPKRGSADGSRATARVSISIPQGSSSLPTSAHSLDFLAPGFSSTASNPVLGLSAIPALAIRATTSAQNVIPLQLSDFNCFAVNVTATDILTQSSCAGASRLGVGAGFVPRGGTLDLDVPMGKARTFQIWGFAGASICSDVYDLPALQPGQLPGGAVGPGFVLGSKTVDVLQGAMTVELDASFSLSTSPLMCGHVDLPSTKVDYARLQPGTETTALTNGQSTNSLNDVCIGFESSANSPKFQCVVDGVATACNQGACKPNPLGGVHQITSANGTHTFMVISSDSGNGLVDGFPPTFTWTRDTTPPVATLAGIAPGKKSVASGIFYSQSATPAFLLTANEGVTVTYKLDGGAFAPCGTIANASTFSCQLPTLAGGNHALVVHVVDLAGNAQAPDLNANVYYATHTPTASITPSNGWPMGGDLTSAGQPNAVAPSMSVTAPEETDPSTLTCSVDGGVTFACPSFFDFTSSGRAGKHTVTVYGSDYAGHTTPQLNSGVYIDSLLGGLPVLGRLTPTGGFLADESSAATVRANLPLGVGLNGPTQMALDLSSGRLFVADTSNHRVLVYGWNSSTNTVTSRAAIAVFGQQNLIKTDPGSTNTAAYTPMHSPSGVAVGGSPLKLFVADTANNRVLRFDISTGNANTIADVIFGQATSAQTGSNSNSSAGSDTATMGNLTTGLNSPSGLFFNSTNGSLYVADTNNCRVAVYANAATIAAGTNNAAISLQVGANGQSMPPVANWNCTNMAPSTDTHNVYQPTAVFGDVTNNRLYVADTGFHRIAYWNGLSTLASGAAMAGVIGQANATTNGGCGDSTTSTPSLCSPSGVSVIVDGATTYVAASSVSGTTTNKVRFFSTAGAWHFDWNSAGTSGASATAYHSPSQLLGVAATNTLFVSDTANNRVAFVPYSPLTSDIAMRDEIGHSNFTGIASSFTASGTNSPNEANLNGPTHAVVDLTNLRLYVADTGNNRVLMYLLNPITLKPSSPFAAYILGVPETFSGVLPMLDAPTTAAAAAANTLNAPKGLALDSVGRLYVADSGNNRVVRFPTNTLALPAGIGADLVLGQSSSVTSAAGAGVSAMSSPTDVAYDATNDRLFVSDTNNCRVLVFASVSNLSTGTNNGTVMGTTGTCTSTQTTLARPEGLAYTAGVTGILNKGLFVTDRTNHRVNYYDLSGGITSTAAGCYGHHAGTVANMCSTAGNANANQALDGGTLAANGTWGLSSPQAVYFSSTNDYLYISDTGNSRVVAFDLSNTANQPANGAFSNGNVAIHAMGARDLTLAALAGTTAAPAALKSPTGIFRLTPASGTNLLYIVDPAWHRVGVYEAP